MRKRRPHPEYLPEYLATKAFLFLAQALPLPAALRLGEWGGRQVMRWTPGQVRTATENLMAAFPEMTPAQAAQMTRRVYEHFGRSLVEVAMAHRMIRPSTVARHVTIRDDRPLREVIAAGKGAICVTAHLGVWEILGMVLRQYGVDPISVYRPVHNPLMDGELRRRRVLLGQRIIPRVGAFPTLLRTLRANGYIALVVDQYAKGDGVWVPFFGRPASTTPAPALLALRTGAPILMGGACRVEGTYRFEMFLDEPLYVIPGSDRDEDVRRVTEEISRRLEKFICNCPEQWLWMHRRWRVPNVKAATGRM